MLAVVCAVVPNVAEFIAPQKSPPVGAQVLGRAEPQVAVGREVVVGVGPRPRRRRGDAA